MGLPEKRKRSAEEINELLADTYVVFEKDFGVPVADTNFVELVRDELTRRIAFFIKVKLGHITDHDMFKLYQTLKAREQPVQEKLNVEVTDGKEKGRVNPPVPGKARETRKA